MYNEEFKIHCEAAVRQELNCEAIGRVNKGSEVCEMWVPNAFKDLFQDRFIFGDAGKKYGLKAYIGRDVYGKLNNTFRFERL